MRIPSTLTATAALALLLVGPAGATKEVGSITGREGLAELGRAKIWAPASIGQSLDMGDTLRTGADGRLSAVFQDESVLHVGTHTTLALDQTVFDTNSYRTLLRLLRGKVRALVADFYAQPGASFQIETPNSVTGVRGTEFVVSYDEATATTEVSCLGGRVAVHSIADRSSRGVICEAGRFTRVLPDAFPTAPKPMPPAQIDKLRHTLSRADAGPKARPGLPVPNTASVLVAAPEQAAQAPTVATVNSAPGKTGAKTNPAANKRAATGLRTPTLRGLGERKRTPGGLIGQPPKVAAPNIIREQ